MGLVAQKTKIPEEIATEGMYSRGVWGVEEIQKWKAERKFMIWYDNELQKNGIHKKMLFVSGPDSWNVKLKPHLAKPVALCTELIGGYYFRMPIRGQIRL